MIASSSGREYYVSNVAKPGQNTIGFNIDYGRCIEIISRKLKKYCNTSRIRTIIKFYNEEDLD